MNKENRKLSTILAMDVVSYSSKMAEDDVGTLKLLAERRIVIEKYTKSHGGRIFNTAGDAFMIDFSSPVEAVNAAIKIQKEWTKGEQWFCNHCFHLNRDMSSYTCEKCNKSRPKPKIDDNIFLNKLSLKIVEKL